MLWAEYCYCSVDKMASHITNTIFDDPKVSACKLPVEKHWYDGTIVFLVFLRSYSYQKSLEEKQVYTLVAILVINFIYHPIWIAKKFYMLTALEKVRALLNLKFLHCLFQSNLTCPKINKICYCFLYNLKIIA